MKVETAAFGFAQGKLSAVHGAKRGNLALFCRLVNFWVQSKNKTGVPTPCGGNAGFPIPSR